MDNKKIYVGNLSYGTTLEALIEAFLKFGEIVDSYKPEGKGFAFLTFATAEQAQNAIEAMNGQELDGREISVSIAKPKEDRPRRSFGGDRRGGGYNRDRGGDRRDFRNRY